MLGKKRENIKEPVLPVLRNQYTGVGNIYAVGDVAGGNLATVGTQQAVRAVRPGWWEGQGDGVVTMHPRL